MKWRHFISSLCRMCLVESRAGGSSVPVWRRRFDFSIFPISSFDFVNLCPSKALGGCNLPEEERGIFLWETLSKEVHWLWCIVSTFERGHLIFGRICTYLIYLYLVQTQNLTYHPRPRLISWNMPFPEGARVRRMHPKLLEMHFFKPLFIPSLSASLSLWSRANELNQFNVV